jgi:glycosyltransferase involved in cell wall biosynthesis
MLSPANTNRARVIVSSFQCKAEGTSESYSGYQWMEQIARFQNVTLLTADKTTAPPLVEIIQPSERYTLNRGLIRRINGEVKLDYFRFNRRSKSHLRNTISSYQLVHHVAPIAPRYPCSLGILAKRFIIGPVGGGLRAPAPFQEDVERHEESFFKLRMLDKLRLDHDPLLRRTYKAADLIVIVAKYMFGIIPHEFHSKCRIMLDTGINLESHPFANPIARSDDQFLNLLYVGRIVPYKGLLYLLRAIQKIAPIVQKRVKLSVIGDRGEGAYELECKNYVVREGLHQVVKFHGYKNKSEIAEYYSNADLFVFPSLAEAGGNVVIEAMAAGCPVLAANWGGPSEVVTTDSGYLIDPRHPDYLIDRISKIIASLADCKDALHSKRIESRKIIERRFDWTKKGEVMREWYDEIIQNP